MQQKSGFLMMRLICLKVLKACFILSYKKYLSIFSKPGDKRPVSPVVKDTATAYADNDERVRNDIQSSYSVSTDDFYDLSSHSVSTDDLSIHY